MLITKFRILTHVTDNLYSVADGIMLKGVLDTATDNGLPQYLFEFYDAHDGQNKSLLFKIDSSSATILKTVSIDIYGRGERIYQPERTYRLVKLGNTYELVPLVEL